jgi:hypothetical protein
MWLNDVLIYHNQMAPPRWMPEVRHFDSDRLQEGRYRLVVQNRGTGERHEHEFAAADTRHIVVFDRLSQPMVIRTFPHRVAYR